ncbi:MAG: response regulator transcription factor [Microbacteriaceae bacterium]
MIDVLVVDDQPIIRTAVRALLEQEHDLRVVGEAADGREALAVAHATGADVVIMDIRMPGLDGIAATAAICRDPALTSTRVLILTTFEEDGYIVDALRVGASGFIGKASEPEQIVRAVRAVFAGEALLSPIATRALITRHLTGAD